MSHVVAIKTELRDLEAVKAACQRLGFKFLEGQTTFKWYGRWFNDYNAEDAAFRRGIEPEDYGKCHHAISVPNTSMGYEAGLVRQGDYYVLSMDFFDSGLTEQMGGKDCGKFLQAYAVEKTKLEARRQGMTFSETALADGSVELTLTEY
jgi:hypothetical protein